MKDREVSEETKKQNSTAIGDDPESLQELGNLIESEIDHMEISEFDDEEEEWHPFRKKADAGKKKSPSDKEEQKSVLEEEETASGTEPEESDDFEEPAAEPDGFEDSEEPEEETEESDLFEEADDREEDFDADLDDAAYIQSAAYRKKEKRRLSYEQREARREKRIEAFWDFVVRRRKQIRWSLLGLLVVIASVIAGVVSNNWTYHTVKNLVVSEKEDTLSVSYANINGKVLKYGVDGAMLVDYNNSMLWTISYTMHTPEVALCGDMFAIYDKKGTGICICDASGRIGEVSADMPVVKVNVSKQGVVAAVLEDGQNAWIKLYKSDGSELATLKTTFTNPGYPMDIGLSEDGNLLAVSYLYLDNGTPVSRVSFYNFGTVGQNQRDNLVSETEYRDRILPEVVYMDAKTCVAFREDGFSVFSGGQIPLESVKVDTDQNIVSTFHDSEYIGLVLQNRSAESEYLICLYNKKGKEILRKETDFRYKTVELNGSQIVLSAGDEFCVYSLQGVEKYRGSLELPARAFIGFGRNRFIYVTEDLFRIIQIR